MSIQKDIDNLFIKNGKLVSKRCCHKWINQNCKSFFELSIKQLKFDVTKFSIPQILWHLYYEIYYIPTCVVCGHEVSFCTFSDGYNKTCSNSCAQLNPQTQEKIKSTNRKRYGVEYALMSSDIRTKSINTCLRKYGKSNVSQVEEVKHKKESTCLKNHGTKYFLENHTSISESVFKKYGKYNVSQVDDIKKSRSRTRRKLFFNKILNANRLAGLSVPLFNEQDYVIGGYYSKYKFQCCKCCEIFEDCLEDGDIPRCPTCFQRKSNFEFEISNYIKSIYSGSVLENDRLLLNGKELDIFIPDKGIAIECNGLFWHSEENGKDKNYHLDKSIDCKNKGIRLIHLFEDEWLLKKDIVKNYLFNLFNKSETVYARDCIVRDITTLQSSEFLDNYHFQGKDNSSIKIGLFHNNQLISVLTVGKSRFERDAYEIYRYCSSKTVIGGFAKLLSYLLKNNIINRLITYSDYCKFTGDIYLSNNFKLVKLTEPGYWYFSRKKYFRQHRFNFRKSVLNEKLDVFDSSLSEYENMINNGYNRIWDCGNLKFEYIYK